MTRSYDDTKIKDINKNLAICQNLDIQFAYLQKSQFICCSDLVEQINPDKKPNIYKFFGLKYMQPIIQQLDKQIQFIQKYEGLKIISKDKHTCYFEVINKEEFKQYNGYYIHEDLYLQFISWLNIEKFLEYQRLFNNYLKILTLQNMQTTKEALALQSKQLETLKKQIPSNQLKLTHLKNACRKSVNHHTEKFRKENEDEICAECEEETDCEVDHVIPFMTLFDKFIRKYELDEINLNEIDDLISSFQKFHKANAKFQYLCSDCHKQKTQDTKQTLLDKNIKLKNDIEEDPDNKTVLKKDKMDAFRRYYTEYEKLPPAKYVEPETGIKLGYWIADMKTKGACRKERNILEKEFDIKIQAEYKKKQFTEKEKIQEFIDYYESHDHKLPPYNYVNPETDFNLGTFVSSMKNGACDQDIKKILLKKYPKLKLETKQQIKLSIEEKIQIFCDYYEENEKLPLRRYVDSETRFQLGEWVSGIKNGYYPDIKKKLEKKYDIEF